MTDSYENIRKALAMRPTPGPWEVANGTDVFTRLGARNAAGVEAADNDGWHIADCDMGPSSTGGGEADIPSAEKRGNARLIAACDPDTIRELLAERDQLAAALEAAREDVRHLEPWRDAVFDGASVFAALNRSAKARTSPENVSDALDAVANVARAAIDLARGKGVADA